MKIINKTVYPHYGVLKPIGVVIHNDDGSSLATPEHYLNWLPTHNPAVGFAHYYGNKDAMLRAMDTNAIAWHCGNSWGNANLLSYEVCQSHVLYGVSDAEFLLNEEAVFEQVAQDMKYYGLVPSRNTVFLHRALSSTSCPQRSWFLHVGRNAPDTEANRNKLIDYFVMKIKEHMNGKVTPSKPVAPQKPSTPTGGGVKVEPYNVKQVVDTDVLNVRASQNTKSTVVSQLKKGQVFNATRICRNGENVSGYTTWFEVNGRGWVSGALVSPAKGGTKPSTPAPKPQPQGNWIAEHATFIPNQTINVRTAPNTSAECVAQYHAGDSVVYNAKIVQGGYVWIRYTGGSGKQRYMAVRQVVNGQKQALWGTIK